MWAGVGSAAAAATDGCCSAAFAGRPMKYPAQIEQATKDVMRRKIIMGEARYGVDLRILGESFDIKFD